MKDGSTLYVGYNYDTTADGGEFTKNYRLKSVRYPNARLVHYMYGAAGDAGDYAALYERHESTGRPSGPKRFVVMLEKALARVLQPRKRGRRARQTG